MSTQPRTGAAQAPRAFTLVELLVAIALIAVIVALVIVAARGVRSAGTRTQSLTALRNLASAHSSYAAEHRQRFLPGYLDPALLTSFDIDVTLPSGAALSQNATGSYVFRLAPYLDWEWKTAFREQLDGATETALEQAYADGTLDGFSLQPAFGLNSVFIGGNSTGAVPDWSPWNGVGNETVAATRLSQIKNPAQTILFGSTRYAENATVEPLDGWHELRAPFLIDAQWTAENTGATPAGTMGSPAGLPGTGDDGAIMVLANLDGSTETTDVSEVSVDMRRWAPFATEINWRIGD